jgi:hypothetical protein
LENTLVKSLLAVLFATMALSLSAEPALLGNKAMSGQTLDSASVKAVLMGKKVALGDARVVLVISRTGDAQNAFLQAHVGMTTSQFQNHWRRLFMTGGGTAPKIVETEVDAIKLASATPGAIVIADTANADALAVLAMN